jgi:hypothetical protein
MPCSPEELVRLASLGADDKVGESAVQTIKSYEEMGLTDPATAETKSKMGWLGFVRTQRGAFGEEFTAKALNRLQLALQQTHNVEAKHFKIINDGIAEAFDYNWFQKIMGPSSEQMVQIQKAIRLTDASGIFKGPKASFPDEIIAAARNIRRGYAEAEKDFGLDADIYTNFYAPGRVQRPNGLLWGGQTEDALAPVRDRLSPSGLNVIAELERKGVLSPWEDNAATLFRNYVQAGARAKILAPVLRDIEKEFVNPYFDLQLVRAKDGRYLSIVNDRPGYESWRGLRDHALGLPTNLDRQMAATFKSFGESMGVDGMDIRHLYNVSQAYSNLWYGGVLGSPFGGRPGSVIRNLFQMTNTYAEFGAKDTLAGIQKAMTPGSWAEYQARGVLTAPYEGIHHQMDLARGVGRTLSWVTSNSTKLFDASDRLMRVATAAAADLRFDRALDQNFAYGLKGGKDISDHIVSLAKQGQLDRARNEYAMHAVAETMYVYGKGNRPQAFRGVLGNALGILTSYPINMAEMYGNLGKRAIRGWREDRSLEEAMPLIRQIGASVAGMYAGSELLNTDLSSVYFTGALPESIAGLSAPLHAYQAGRSNLVWMGGNLFQTGETDFAKRRRGENNRAFLRDVGNFVPGGLFMREGLDVIDNHSFQNVMKHMGFPPLAEDANIEARRKMRETMQQNRLEAFPQVGEIKPF